MTTYDKTLRGFFDNLQDTQWFSRQQLEAYQRRQLAHILLHAARTSLLYKDRLVPVLRGNDSFDWDRWNEIPILKRHDLQERASEAWSNAVPENHGSVLTTSTSGSTGAPIHMKSTELSSLVRRAAVWRTYSWHSLDFTRPLAVTTGSARWPEGATEGQWGSPWTAGPAGPRLTIELMTPIPRLTEWLHRKKVGYVGSHAMLLTAIAEEAWRQGIKLDLAGMIAFGMQATVFDREAVARLLGIPIIESYSSEECGPIAQQCEAGALHVLSELLLVEIVDENDQPCPLGVEGRVIVTDLYNAAQPLIRYEQGDITAFAGPCRCGRSLPVIKPISGRIRHMFKFAAGPRFSLSDHAAYEILKPHLEPSWYQIAQTGDRSIEVRFVARVQPPAGYQAAIGAAMLMLLRRDDISVSFRQFDSIPTPLGQKHILFVNEHENRAHELSIQ